MKKVFQGNVFSVWQWDQKLYDGSTSVFEKIGRPDAASVIGILPDKRILLVWDEQPGRGGLLAPAGGQLEMGEKPEEAAAREFREETGYAAGSLSLWFSHEPSNRILFTAYFYIGKNIEKVSEPSLDAGEKIELRFFTFDEFLMLGQNPKLRDSEMRIMLLEAQLDPAKKDILYKLLYE